MVAVIKLKSKEEMELERDCTFFVKGVVPPLTIASLEYVISEHAIVSSIFPTFSNTVFKGTVCVILKSADDVTYVRNLLDGATIDGVEISIDHFDQEFKDKQKRNCYVTGIPLKWDVNDFKSYCEKYGKVDSCSLRGRQEGKEAKDQHGYVSFVDYLVPSVLVNMSENDRLVCILNDFIYKYKYNIFCDDEIFHLVSFSYHIESPTSKVLILFKCCGTREKA